MIYVYKTRFHAPTLRGARCSQHNDHMQSGELWLCENNKRTIFESRFGALRRANSGFWDRGRRLEVEKPCHSLGGVDAIGGLGRWDVAVLFGRAPFVGVDGRFCMTCSFFRRATRRARMLTTTVLMSTTSQAWGIGHLWTHGSSQPSDPPPPTR
jgi:hypothetical protein